MRKIPNTSWNEKNTDGTDKKVSLVDALNVLINALPPHDLPRGIDNFRTFNKISKAFKSAEETGTLLLEDAEYSFLKQKVEASIPAGWGQRVEVLDAIECFLKAESFVPEVKEEEKK